MGSNASTETAKIHKPYVLSPSFVFGDITNEEEVIKDSFVTSVPLKTFKINQAELDLKNVMVSYTNENYVPPSSLPKLPPLHFHTFKRPNQLKPKNVNSINPVVDSVELAPSQIESNVDSIELAPNQD